MKIRIEIDTADLPSVGTPVEKRDESGCPIATQDIDVNLENRQKAIDEYDYGPLDPGVDDSGQLDKYSKYIQNRYGGCFGIPMC